MGRMKAKMHNQVQPLEIAPPRSAHVHFAQGDVQEEIRNFLRAVDSYAARVAKEPRVTFRQHLCSISAGRNEEGLTRDRRSRRH
jgi:hypothetical protein